MSLKCQFWRDLFMLSSQQEKMMDFDYCEEYWRSASNKYYYGSDKKSIV